MLTRRALGIGLTGAGLLASAGRGALAQGLGHAADPQSLVDPELRPIWAQMAPRLQQRHYTRAGLAQMRQGPPAAPLPSGVTERSIPGLSGDPPVKVYVVNAVEGGSRPAILHIHGGGYITGSAWSSVRGAQATAQALDAVVMTVEYRLAPETPFPGPLDDCYAALLWLHENARSLGVDPRRIAVKGESAGGGLAAMLALRARDRREVPLCGQLLIYPMLDDRTGSARKVANDIPYLWTPQANVFGWASFLGRAPGGASEPDGAVPARARSVAGLPPTFIGVGSIDLFASEDIAYAKRLMAEGVPTQLLVLPGAFHAFDGVAPQSQLSKAFVTSWQDALRRFFRSV